MRNKEKQRGGQLCRYANWTNQFPKTNSGGPCKYVLFTRGFILKDKDLFCLRIVKMYSFVFM